MGSESETRNISILRKPPQIFWFYNMLISFWLCLFIIKMYSHKDIFKLQDLALRASVLGLTFSMRLDVGRGIQSAKSAQSVLNAEFEVHVLPTLLGNNKAHKMNIYRHTHTRTHTHARARTHPHKHTHTHTLDVT